MKSIVEVQFTGNAKLYTYLFPQYCYWDNQFHVNPGDRIVVINKLKDDNTPSLSIATVINVGECSDEAAAPLKPFVQLVPKDAIDFSVLEHLKTDVA